MPGAPLQLYRSDRLNSKIRWAVLEELKGQDLLPRRVQKRAREVEKATSRLVRKLGRPPMEAKIAEEAGLEAIEYRDFLDQYSRG